MTAKSATKSSQDFSAALYEINSNLDVRRLMFVLSNVLVPALAMAMSDCLTGSDYPPELAWLPRHIVVIVGALMAITGTLVCGILVRCHFGMVVNGSKMHRVLTGHFLPRPLNWFGVTTNFVALTALSSGAGLSLMLAAIGYPLLSWVAGPALLVLVLLSLRVNHWRANRLCARLNHEWQYGDVPRELREQHARLSLDATTSDIAVVVTMAAALFAGTFNSMTNLGGIPDELRAVLPVDNIKEMGVTAISAFLMVSLLLSGRMVVRLRIALAEHSEVLAGLRDEPDDSYSFRTNERTFLLFVVLLVLTSAAGMILVWSLMGTAPGMLTGAGLLALGLIGYPLRLASAGRRARGARAGGS